MSFLISKTPASKPSTKRREKRKKRKKKIKPIHYSKTAECSEIDLGSMCLFTLEYALKSEDQGHRLQRAERIYGVDSTSESAM